MLRRVELLSNYIPFLGMLSNIPKIKANETVGKIQDKTGNLDLDGLNDYASSIMATVDDVDRERKLSGTKITVDNCSLAVISADVIGYLSFSDMDRLKERISGLYLLLQNDVNLSLRYGKVLSVLFYLDKIISERQKQYVEEMLLQPISEAQELAQSLGAPVIVESLQSVKEVVGAVAHDLVKKDNFYAAVQSLRLEPLCRNIREVADEFSYVTTSPGEKMSLIEKFEKQWCVDKKDNSDANARNYGFVLRLGMTRLITAIRKFFSEHDEKKEEKKESKSAKKEASAASLQNGLFHFSEKCKEEAEADLESRLNLVAPVR